jgi:hypothetical protein
LLEAPEDLIFGLSLENQGDSPPSAAVLKGYPQSVSAFRVDLQESSGYLSVSSVSTVSNV